MNVGEGKYVEKPLASLTCTGSGQISGVRLCERLLGSEVSAGDQMRQRLRLIYVFVRRIVFW